MINYQGGTVEVDFAHSMMHFLQGFRKKLSQTYIEVALMTHRHNNVRYMPMVESEIITQGTYPRSMPT